jgi:hypothetical protein
MVQFRSYVKLTIQYATAWCCMTLCEQFRIDAIIEELAVDSRTEVDRRCVAVGGGRGPLSGVVSVATWRARGCRSSVVDFVSECQ